MSGAIADDKGADGPEDDEQTGARKDASVEYKDGDFCEGDGGVIKDQVCEDDLVRQYTLVLDCGEAEIGTLAFPNVWGLFKRIACLPPP